LLHYVIYLCASYWNFIHITTVNISLVSFQVNAALK